MHGANHGLGKAFIYISCQGPPSTGVSYPGSNKFIHEGGSASKGNVIYCIRNYDSAERQFDYFMVDNSLGLSQAGMARLNQSIEAFVYCILKAQVKVRSSILGASGSVKETQREFLILMEDAIR